MSSANLLNAFVNLLCNFLDDLSMTFPELTDVRVFKNSVDMLKGYNPRKIMDSFMYYVAPYYIEIFNKNEDFFVNIENIQKDDHFLELDESEQQQNVVKMVQLKDMWTDLSDSNKDKIWKYFKALLKIGSQTSSHEEYKCILAYLKENPHLF